MSESGASDVQRTAVPHAATAGAALRTAREAAGLHIAALAVALKVPVKKLEALEADDIQALPDAVFARALAASVCRTLKIDPAPVLALLPQMQTPPLQVGVQGRAVRLETGRSIRLPDAIRLPRPVLITAAALLLAAVVVLALPTLRDVLGAGAASDTAAAEPVSTAPATGTSVTTVEVPTAPQTAASAASAVLPAAAVPLAAAPVAAAPASAAVPTLAVDANAIAVFSARAPSWVQVSGADGVVHLRKTMNAGDVERIGGALPLDVVIGRANAIDVQVRGKALELTSLAKDNVARFQIR